MRAREPIFSETHTNWLGGTGKSTPQPAGSCAPLLRGRWVYEKREGRAKAGGLGAAAQSARASSDPVALCRPLALCAGCGAAPLWGCELASPFLAKPIQMSFAGLGNPPLSPPARARHCALVGGYMRKEKPKSPVGGLSRHTRHLSTAAFAGRSWSHFIHRRLRVVPYGLPGYRRLRRAPPQHRCCPGARASGSHGIWEDSAGAREYPICAEGWALWVHGGSPNLLEATGGTYRLGTPQG